MINREYKNCIGIVLSITLATAVLIGCVSRNVSMDGSEQQTDNTVTETQQPTVNPEEVFGYDAEPDDIARVANDVADTQAPVNAEAKESSYHSPIDFKELHRQNPDIAAWISVPGTNISYPVCQNADDDAYYLNHNSNRQLDVNGAIFTEASYNNDDFSDPATVVYGHNMKSGRMFGYLEETFRDGFKGHDEAIVYLPDGEVHYQFFAALRVPSGHLLAGRNLYKADIFKNFVRSITGNKDLYSVIDHSVEISPDDRLILLSTCVGGDSSQRYIVVGKRVSEASSDPNRRMAETR